MYFVGICIVREVLPAGYGWNGESITVLGESIKIIELISY